MSTEKHKPDDAAHEAGESCADETCEECCEHEFDPGEGYMCLNCGKEGAEDYFADACDRAKDARKYGDT